jgi:hypothetical protein
MPEAQNVDIAHHLHEVSERQKEEEKEERHRSMLHEIIEALLLALVAILTAWSGYQAARWDGRNALYYGEANKDRVTATQVSNLGGQFLLFDATTFNGWLAATVQGNTTLGPIYVQRFTPPYRVAFDAWLKTDPLHNPKAPPGPGYMPQYHNPQLDQANALNNAASAVFEQGTSARETADKYVRATILLATVLFLVALSQRFKAGPIRLALLVLGTGLVAYALAELATYPTA